MAYFHLLLVLFCAVCPVVDTYSDNDLVWGEGTNGGPGGVHTVSCSHHPARMNQGASTQRLLKKVSQCS